MTDKHTIAHSIEEKRAKIEAKGGRVCDNFETCHNRATQNIQECAVRWTIDARGNYSKKPVEYMEINGDNQHLCDDCAF